MANLLEETKTSMAEGSKTFDDVAFISITSGEISIDNFKAMADKDYDDGYGSQEVYSSLIVMFKDNTWLSMWEYDGSEGWEYNRIPMKPREETTATTIFFNDYSFREE